MPPSTVHPSPEGGLVAMPDLVLPPGTLIDEFEIQGQLGVGGFGVVYRAFDRALERTVAIKEYLPQQSATRVAGGQVLPRTEGERDRFETGLKAFVREARMLASFDHPSLVKVYRYGEHHGTAYMVMPCYEGQTLIKARASLGGPPDQPALWKVLQPLMEAVQQLHARDVLHRDIAPDNVILLADGVPVLLDFGAARQMVAASTPLTAIFKPSFGAIEQYSNDERSPLGPWTDVYGLASLAHYWLTGQVPQAAVTRILQDDAPSFVQLGRMLHKELGLTFDDGFMRALDWGFSVHPQDRPKSLADWRAALMGQATELVQLPMSELEQRGTDPAAGKAAAQGREAPTGAANDWAETQMLDVTTAWPVTQEAPSAAAPASAQQRERRWMVAGVGAAAVMLAAFVIVVKMVSGRPDALAAAAAASAASQASMPLVAQGPAAVSAPMVQEPLVAAAQASGAVTTTQGVPNGVQNAAQNGMQNGALNGAPVGSDKAKLAAAKAAQKANPPPGKVEAPAVVSRQEAPQVASKPKEPEAVQPAPAAVSPYAQCGSITNPLASLSVLSCRRKSCERPDPRDAKVCQEFKDMEARNRSQEF